MRRPLIAILLPLLAACSSSYYRIDDPRVAHLGPTDDVRLALTQAFGAPLSPIVRNMRAPHGRLHRAQGLEDHLRGRLQPLDIVLIRSRPAMTRLMIPSHFTHAEIWLGSESQMRRLGAWSLPQVRPHHDALKDGRQIIESAQDDVHLSPIREMTDVEEIVILRDTRRSPALKRQKYAALFERIGTTFDYSFDYNDKTRLTCAELVAEAYPEYRLPVRYTTGRRSIVPDDLVRTALERRGPLRFVAWIHSDGAGGFANASAGEVRAVLSSPRPPPEKTASVRQQ